METRKEPECKKYPNTKVKKAPIGVKAKVDKSSDKKQSGQLLKGVNFEVLIPLNHKRVSETHSHTIIITSENRVLKFGLDYWPDKDGMIKLYKEEMAKKPVGPRN